MEKRKFNIWIFIMWISILGGFLCFGFIGFYYWNTLQSENEYEELREEVQEEEPLPTYTLEEVQSIEFTGIIEVDAPAPKVPDGVLRDAEENPVDFERLSEINSELYAWIRIPNTNIDYPIAQRKGEGQGFYLHHDMYQNPRFSGCIYTQNKNSMDFTDPVTVIYGHNMKNGSMFQNLHKFRNQEFFEENRYIYIYTHKGTLVYEIFAAYPYDNRHILDSFDFSDREVLEGYLEECCHPRSMEAQVRKEVTVNADTPIITLSTCIGGQTEQRYLVQAVLVYEESQ